MTVEKAIERRLKANRQRDEALCEKVRTLGVMWPRIRSKPLVILEKKP